MLHSHNCLKLDKEKEYIIPFWQNFKYRIIIDNISHTACQLEKEIALELLFQNLRSRYESADRCTDGWGGVTILIVKKDDLDRVLCRVAVLCEYSL